MTKHSLFTLFSPPGGLPSCFVQRSIPTATSCSRWRNHPRSRSASLTQHEIGADEHARWWSAVEQDPEREVLIYERRDVPAGVVTFFDIDRGADSAWWGYYLDNAGLTARGELMPAWIDIQRKAIRYAFDELSLQDTGGRGARRQRRRPAAEPPPRLRRGGHEHP